MGNKLFYLICTMGTRNYKQDTLIRNVLLDRVNFLLPEKEKLNPIKNYLKIHIPNILLFTRTSDTQKTLAISITYRHLLLSNIHKTAQSTWSISKTPFQRLIIRCHHFLPSKAITGAGASYNTIRKSWVYLAKGQKKKNDVTNGVHILL